MNEFLVFFVIPTVVYFPVYYCVRRLFFRLPLHRDTGFYVSNHTICTKKIDFSKGWNVRFALCSKVIPEFFYSWIYLKHGGQQFGPRSRFYYSLLNYVTAITVGMSAFYVSGNQPIFYCLGFFTYGMISSHPFLGVYFESGEQFEVLFQNLSFLLVFLGLSQQKWFLIDWGIGLWLFESFFIKIVSLGSLAILEGYLVCLIPSLWLRILCVDVIGLIVYAAWLYCNGRRFSQLLFPSVGHEKFSQGHPSMQKAWKQVVRKTFFLFRCLGTHLPIFLMLSIVGIYLAAGKMPLLCAYFFAVLATQFLQGALVWYYLIPLLPPLALFAVYGAYGILSLGNGGSMVIVALFCFWLLYHFVYFRGSPKDLNLKVWKPYGEFMARQNDALDLYAKEIRSKVANRTVFIYGVTNQLYVLLDVSYPIHLISGASWLDYMQPDWQETLNRELVSNPPGFLFSSDSFLEPEIIRNRLGLYYQLTDEDLSGQFRLYQFVERLPRVVADVKCLPYRSDLTLQAREQKVY